MEALSTLIAFSETIVISLAEMSESFVLYRKLLSVTLGFGCLSTHLELKIVGSLTEKRLDHIQSLAPSAFDSKCLAKSVRT